MVKPVACCILFFTLRLCWAENTPISQVFVSILPQKYCVEKIGGKRVNVHVMVGPGQSPETYEPTPRQMTLLSQARLFFAIGIPFEHALLHTIRELNSDIDVVECCTDITLLDAHGQEQTKVDDLDPHVWTDPKNMQYFAYDVQQALSKIIPEHQKEFRRNYYLLINDLKKLNQDINQQLSELKNRYMVVSHPAWAYYARAYNLTQIPILINGREANARSLANLIDFARAKNIRRVFIQKQSNSNVAEVLAREIDADIFVLDPLAEDYIENLYRVTEAIANSTN